MTTCVRRLSALAFVLIFLFLQTQLMIVRAQSPMRVECGTEIESVFSNDLQIHTYQMSVEAGTAIVIYAESMAGNYQNLLVDIELTTPRGNLINEWGVGDRFAYRTVANSYTNYVGATKTVETDALSETGNYTIRVIGYTDTGSPYRFYVSCIFSDGTVISTNDRVALAQCGSIIENSFTRDREIHRYYLSLESRVSTTLFAESIVTNYRNLLLDIELVTPNGNLINEWNLGDRFAYRTVANSYTNYVGETKTVETAPLPETGIYRISVIGYTDTGADYVLQVGCALRDGTVINPGDAPPVNLISTANAPPASAVSQPTISGFGFPGLSPRDFSQGIEIPLQVNQSQTAPIGGDVALYTYQASANESRTLNIVRISGNISIGAAVIKRDTNEIIFFSGLPSSNNLTVELLFPSDGIYAIGLFRLDTIERINTSGAVQITLE